MIYKNKKENGVNNLIEMALLNAICLHNLEMAKNNLLEAMNGSNGNIILWNKAAETMEKKKQIEIAAKCYLRVLERESDQKTKDKIGKKLTSWGVQF